MLGWLTAGSGRAVGGCLGSGACPSVSFWGILAGFSLIVANIYVVNQIADRESDRVNNKLFFLPRGIIPVPLAWVVACVCLSLGMVISAAFGAVLVGLFAAGALVGVLYNLPPFVLKNRPWGGMVANFVGHGTLTYLVGWYSARLSLSSEAVVSSLSPAFANAAVYLVSTVADVDGDRVTGKKTFCVRYGHRATAWTAFMCCFISLVLAFFMSFNRLLMILPAAVSVVFFGYAALVPRHDTAYRAFKWPVFALAVLVAIMTPSYGVLILITFLVSRWYYRRRFGISYPTFKPL